MMIPWEPAYFSDHFDIMTIFLGSELDKQQLKQYLLVLEIFKVTKYRDMSLRGTSHIGLWRAYTQCLSHFGCIHVIAQCDKRGHGNKELLDMVKLVLLLAQPIPHRKIWMRHQNDRKNTAFPTVTWAWDRHVICTKSFWLYRNREARLAISLDLEQFLTKSHDFDADMMGKIGRF